MHTLIIYDEDTNEIIEVTPTQNPIVDGDTVSWNGGAVGGIGAGFIIIEEEITVEVGQDVSPWLNKDKKNQLKPPQKKIAEQLAAMQMMVNTLATDSCSFDQQQQITELQKMMNVLLLQNNPSV